MRDAAQNPSGGAGLTAGIGAGIGIGNLMQQATSGAMQQQQKPQENGGGGKTAAGIPDVMTPAEAASILKVSEEDVVAAIEDGSLKAKKLGKAYRISKESLEAFLNS
jgi:excisionase family DNA binding protein